MLARTRQGVLDIYNTTLDCGAMRFAAYMAEHGLTDGEFAARLGVCAETVRLWRHGKRRIPAERASEISFLTAIPRWELRPDLWDAPVRRRLAKAAVKGARGSSRPQNRDGADASRQVA